MSNPPATTVQSVTTSRWDYFVKKSIYIINWCHTELKLKHKWARFILLQVLTVSNLVFLLWLQSSGNTSTQSKQERTEKRSCQSSDLPFNNNNNNSSNNNCFRFTKFCRFWREEAATSDAQVADYSYASQRAVEEGHREKAIPTRKRFADWDSSTNWKGKTGTSGILNLCIIFVKQIQIKS